MPARATEFNSKGTSIRFPTDVGTEDVPNYVTFRPEMIQYGSFDNTGGYGNSFQKPDLIPYNLKNDFTKRVGGSSVTINNPFKEIANRVEGFVTELSKAANLNFDLPGGIGNVNFNLGKDSLGSIISGRLNLGGFKINLGDSIKQNKNTVVKLPGLHLYLPPELNSQISANYDQKNLGAIGQEAINFVGNNLNNAFTMETAKGVAGAMIQDIVSDNLNAVVQRGIGRAKNNYSYATFNGMKHREFSYTFNLVAKNEQETKNIKAICDSFMFYMLPARASDSFHFFDMPCMWDISYCSFYEGGRKLKFFEQPRKCFLTNVDVKYGADVMGHTYNNGAPMKVGLTLKFMEIEPMMRTDGDTQSVSSPLLKDISDKISDALGSTSSGSNGNTGG